MADEVLRERRGHVELLTINRPEARNAMNRAAAIALGGALDECEGDDDVWVVVLTGAGDKAFSAGMDLKMCIRDRCKQRTDTQYRTTAPGISSNRAINRLV